MSDAIVVGAWHVASLTLVGSDTVRRSTVPSILTIGLVLRRPAAAAWAAIPIFSVWCVVVTAIWLYLIGLSDIAEGSYQVLEVGLTLAIAVCSVAWQGAYVPVARFP